MIPYVAALASLPAMGLTNIGISSYIGYPSHEPSWVGTSDSFGSVTNPKYETIDNPILKYCTGVHAFSAPYEVEACLSHMRATLICSDDPNQQSLGTFVWWSRSVMWGGSTIYSSVLNNPDSPMDGLHGLMIGDKDTLKYFFSQSSFWINFIPMVICSLIGVIMFISIFINLIFFCPSKSCRKCWGGCCCKLSCNDRKRAPVSAVNSCKIGAQCFFTWFHFLATCSFIVVFSYYSLLFSSPYRMNQTACRIMSANYKLAFGENSLFDTGTRMMSLLIEGEANYHFFDNMTGDDKIMNGEGVGHLNEQYYEKMCPKGMLFSDSAIPADLAGFKASSTWKSAVGAGHYDLDGWDQCYRYTPHWAQAKGAYAQKYSWGRIARDYGRRAYYSIVKALDGEDIRFFYFDQFESQSYTYTGYPQTCAIEDPESDERRQCAFIRMMEYGANGEISNLVSTCLNGQVDGIDCARYSDMDAGDSPEIDFSGEINKPYEFYYRISDRNKNTLIPDELLGSVGNMALEGTLGFHMNTGGFQAQGTVYNDIITNGSLESPSGLTTLVANMVNDPVGDMAMDPSTMIGWIREQCAQSADTKMSLASFCTKTMGSEYDSGGIGGFKDGFCTLLIDAEDSTLYNTSTLQTVLDSSVWGRGYQQCLIGSNKSSCLFSDSGTLSNRKDICEIFLSKSVGPRSDDVFSIEHFVTYFRGTPNAIASRPTATIDAGITVDVGAYPATGNYNEATAQHTYFRDVFDTQVYTGELKDSVLQQYPAQIVTPQGGEHPPFLGFSRMSTYIDSLITTATHATATNHHRLPEYMGFLMIIHDAVWVIYDSAMAILPILPVFAPIEEKSSTGWQTVVLIPIIISTILGLLWISMVALWSIIGLKWCKKKQPTVKEAGCYYRGICSFLFIGAFISSLTFSLSSLFVPVIGEVALFCRLEAMTPLSLDGNKLPPLYEDLFGPAATPHPGKNEKYENSLAECIFHGTDFPDGSINFETDPVVTKAAEEIIANLPKLLAAYSSMGMTIDEEVLSNEFAPVWNNGDFAHRDSEGNWVQRTKTMSLLNALDDLSVAQIDAIIAVQNRLNQVIVSTVRGLSKKTDGDVTSFINVGDSPFDPMMSVFVDEVLSVVYASDSELDLEISGGASGVITKQITALKEFAASAVTEGLARAIWLGRVPKSLQHGYIYNGSFAQDGTCARDPTFATNGDFYSVILPNEADWTSEAAVLDFTSADYYHLNFTNGSLPGVFRFNSIINEFANSFVKKFDDLETTWKNASSVPTWETAAIAWMNKFFGEEEMKKPIMDRKICYKSEDEPTGYTPAQLASLGVEINVKDICVLSVRRPISGTFFELEVVNTQFEDNTVWAANGESVLMPVAGACVDTYNEWLKTLELPVIDKETDEPTETDTRKQLMDWHLNNCTTVDDPETNQYHCIRPMRRMSQLFGFIGSVMPDTIIEATEDEAEIRQVYSNLLPYNYGLYKGRDARWSNPIYALFGDDKLDISKYQFAYTNKASGVGSGPDFGVPVFGTRTGVIFGSHGLPPNGFEDMQGFVEYRKCFLGPDAIFPISQDRIDETEEYLSLVANLEGTLAARQTSYERLISFMANVEMIQRHATMTHNLKAANPLTISDLAMVEDYFKLRDLSLLPSRGTALRSNEDLVKDVEQQIRQITSMEAMVRNTARCSEISVVATQAINDICGGALGLIAMIIWQLWLMSLLFLVFYCCGFKQMHYWIDVHNETEYGEESSSTSHVDVLKASYFGEKSEFENTSKHDLEVRDKQNNTCLHMAVFKNHVSTIKKILDINPDLIDSRNSAFYTPLHIAIYENNIEAVEILCERKCNLAVRDEFGDTPLSAAARLGHESIVKILLKHGADPLQATRSLKFAGDIAAMLGHQDIANHIKSEYDDAKYHKAKTYYGDHDQYSSYSSYEFDYVYENEPVIKDRSELTSDKPKVVSRSSSDTHKSINVSSSDEPVVVHMDPYAQNDSSRSRSSSSD